MDDLVCATGRRFERYIVDDDPTSDEDTRDRLDLVIAEARACARCVTVVIATTACLGVSRRARNAVLADLLAGGLVVGDPSGALHPAASTVALARAAARRRAPRAREGAIDA